MRSPSIRPVQSFVFQVDSRGNFSECLHCSCDRTTLKALHPPCRSRCNTVCLLYFSVSVARFLSALPCVLVMSIVVSLGVIDHSRYHLHDLAIIINNIVGGELMIQPRFHREWWNASRQILHVAATWNFDLILPLHIPRHPIC